MSDRIPIYLAGPITPDKAGKDAVAKYHDNIRNGELMTDMLVHSGFAPYPVFSNWTWLMRYDVPVETYYECDCAWLVMAKAALFMTGWEASVGCKREHDLAQAHAIPCFYSIQALLRWKDKYLREQKARAASC